MAKPLKQVERIVEQLGDDNFIRIEPNNTRWLQLGATVVRVSV